MSEEEPKKQEPHAGMENNKLFAVLFFCLGGKEYGIEIKAIREILKYERTQAVPLAPSFLNRIMNVRGQIVTIFFLSRFLKLKEPLNKGDPSILVLWDKEVQAAIYVDSVCRIEHIGPECLHPVPASLSGEKKGILFKGELETQAGERKILLFNPETILKLLKGINLQKHGNDRQKNIIIDL